MIREAAARHLARTLFQSYEVTDLMIDLAATLIQNHVDIDECQQKIEETDRLIEAAVPPGSILMFEGK